VIFVSVMATNTLVVYGMTMSYENLRPRSNYLRAALVIGLISIAGVTWQGILDRFVSFLFLISALFVPVFAIMIVDYWILRRWRYSTRDLVVTRGGAYWYLAGVNPIAVGSFVVGAALPTAERRSDDRHRSRHCCHAGPSLDVEHLRASRSGTTHHHRLGW
jgi:NCS1 family nucleobase:cation symporter-1